jgi:hypothetical protein
MSMTDKEKDDQVKKSAFIFTAINLQLDEAALTAAHHGQPLEIFLQLAEDSYIEVQETLGSLRSQMRAKLDELEAKKAVEDAKIENDSKGG